MGLRRWAFFSSLLALGADLRVPLLGQALPVVDEDDKLQGIITMGDALDAVFPEVKEAAEG